MVQEDVELRVRLEEVEKERDEERKEKESLSAALEVATRSIINVQHHKVREYFVYRDGHGLGSMAIHLAHHCFSFNMRWIRNLTPSRDSAHQITPLTNKS